MIHMWIFKIIIGRRAFHVAQSATLRYFQPIFRHKVLGHSYTMSSFPLAPLKRRRSPSPDVNSDEAKSKTPRPEKKKMKLMTSVQRRLARLLQKQKRRMIAVARKVSLGFSAIMAKRYLAKVLNAYVASVPVAGSEGPQSKSFLPVKCLNSRSPDHHIYGRRLESIPQTGSTELGGATNFATPLLPDNSIVSSASPVSDENDQMGVPIFSIVKNRVKLLCFRRHGWNGHSASWRNPAE